MSYRPYPNAELALRHLRRTRAVYQYGRVPQRYVIGLGQDVGDIRDLTEDEHVTLLATGRL